MKAAFAVLRDGLRVLCVERREAPGVWSLPGGKVEPGETPLEAAVRELREETGLRALSIGLAHVGPGRDRQLYAFAVRGWMGEHGERGPEGDRLAWLDPAELVPFLGPDFVAGLKGAR